MKKVLNVCLAIILVIALTACGGPDLSSPETTVKGFFEAVKALKLEDIQKYLGRSIINEKTLGLNYLPESFVSLLRDLNGATNYTIGTSEIDGDNAKVSVDVDYIDSNDIIKDAYNDYITKAKELAAQGKKMTSADMENLLIDSIRNCAKKNNPKRETSTVTLDLVKNDGIWNIDGISDNIAEVILCNLVEAINSLQ